MRRSPKPKKAKTFYFRSWFISQIRRNFRRYPPYYITLHAGRKEFTIPSKTGKPMNRVLYPCIQCGGDFKQSDIRVDHIVPVVGPEGFPLNDDGSDNWSEYIKRLYCDVDNLQRLCCECHDIKSKQETENRKKYRYDLG